MPDEDRGRANRRGKEKIAYCNGYIGKSASTKFFHELFTLWTDGPELLRASQRDALVCQWGLD
ncbi:MAG TPA: hypothetical protein VMR17_17900 [Xanthobacteraceae bacterium]|nr:hypothetical protein [Xanthobacteraceae bacterium]